jgi:rhodanese-related sulfurtransferase
MTTLNNPTLAQAHQRAQAENLPFAGVVTPKEAYALLTSNPAIKLVDVRTNAERDWIGKVSINPEQHLAIEWTQYPGGTQNSQFITQLAAQADKETVILFLCRSGVRSRHAAKLATEHGYTKCYDILGGFEGNKDNQGHRKQVDGWCFDGLPWVGA